MKSAGLPRIDVRPVPLRAHDSFEAAIRASNLAKVDRADEAKPLEGSAIVSHKSSGADLLLELSTGKTLTISADGIGADWHLKGAEQPCSDDAIPSVVELVFHSIVEDKQVPYVWHRGKLLDSVVGAVISSILAVDGLVYFSLRKIGDLTFTSSVIVNEDDGEHMLFFCWDD